MKGEEKSRDPSGTSGHEDDRAGSSLWFLLASYISLLELKKPVSWKQQTQMKIAPVKATVSSQRTRREQSRKAKMFRQ